ncbi:hypothetical protein CEUSTIGMA_g9247.t1 [Chlamydomonas eustigma]|uniref:Uncharacterized protein n=1 Tax=Chlamydomonas eustigma TaxID=1157962 RepID=A0A250XFY5_9CHLO|nr:hypothetical protein CEUSTIGMA_g9247.t1 [Chlamydomonas eustigma]|eukprot:GAX81819.1 hypothetical protein CEUSTIGMA_g9247.t1 [Chlamydomonas eustigma]
MNSFSNLNYSSHSARNISLTRLKNTKASKRTTVSVQAGLEYNQLKGISVVKANTNERVELLSLWQAEPGTKVAIPFLTHFADLSSWEYAQKLVKVLPTLEDSGVKVFVVGIGSAANAQEFSRALKFPSDRLYADPEATAYKALGFSPGFAPGLEISPYAKLITMCAGIGSPGTLQEVFRGYLGDKSSKPVFEGPTPFDVLGTGYQRPMELATLRLFNMVAILPKWGELSPPDQSLVVQQGGTVVLDGTETIFRHDDSGILKYTDIDALLRSSLKAEEVMSEPAYLVDV